MTSAQIRQLALLAGLGTTLVTVVVVQRGGAPAADVASAPAAQGRPATLNEQPVVDIRLEALSTARDGDPVSARNPFRFQARATPAAAGGGGGGGARRALPRMTEPEPSAPAVPAGPPPPPPIALRFIGVVDPSGSDARAAIFSDMRGNVFSGREGDIIEGRYRVVRVGADAAELVYLDGRGRQTIRLSGQ